MKKLEFHTSEEKKTLRNAVILSGVLVILDHATKLLILNHFGSVGAKPPISVIPGFFSIVYVLNPGAAWGIFSGYGWLLMAISIIAFIAILYFIRNLTEGWSERYFAFFMILSGIIGNTIDRVWNKEVIDFLDFYIGKHHWPAFNIADSSITIGVGVFMISSFFRPQPDKKEIAEGKVTDAGTDTE